jgi:membrane protein
MVAALPTLPDPRAWWRALKEALFGETPVLAGGAALFAFLATIPALGAIASLYGLIADPWEITEHLDGLDAVLPDAVVDFVIIQLRRHATRSGDELGTTLFLSLVLSIYSTRAAVGALITGLNHAYDVEEHRNRTHRVLLGVAVALATKLGLLILTTVIVALSAFALPLGLDNPAAARLLTWPLFLAVVVVAFAGLYRAAPAPRADGRRKRTWPGAITATLVLIVTSWGLGVWVERIGDYEVLYGALASVITVVVWFYVATLVILFGAQVNGELEAIEDGARS